MHVEVRQQLVGVGPHLPPCGSQLLYSDAKLGGKRRYPLSHLTSWSPCTLFLIFSGLLFIYYCCVYVHVWWSEGSFV